MNVHFMHLSAPLRIFPFVQNLSYYSNGPANIVKLFLPLAASEDLGGQQRVSTGRDADAPRSSRGRREESRSAGKGKDCTT